MIKHTRPCYGLGDLFTEITEEFNKYSLDNNLDIQLKLNLFSNKNITYVIGSYTSYLEIALGKKTEQYDIYVYDSFDNRNIVHYLVDLKDILGKESQIYLSKDMYKLSTYFNQWPGL
ncbi:hypothetical protein PIROE2DRAFT_11270, partial [Piromyces sp. E2]